MSSHHLYLYLDIISSIILQPTVTKRIPAPQRQNPLACLQTMMSLFATTDDLHCLPYANRP
jgi:hypothetical protein